MANQARASDDGVGEAARPEASGPGEFETMEFDYTGDSQRWFDGARPDTGVEPADPPRGVGGGPADDPFEGKVLVNRYRMLRRVGTGGFGAVYEAEDTKIRKRVAVKVLARDLVGDASMVSRFRKEAEAASKVGHENIIDITDFDRTAGGHYFLVMEFLDGTDLGAIIRSGDSISLARVLGIMVQVCRGLECAHDKGIIHRDLKPGNIYLTARGSMVDFVKLLDFGITKFTEMDDDGSRLTRTGQIIGTPMYMSPEQAMGEEDIDHRADIYSLGVIMYEMVTGQPPFTAVNYLGIIAQHASDPPTPPSKVRPDLDIPGEVETIILKALAKRPEDRYADMAEMEAALVHALAGVDPAVAVGFSPDADPPSILTTATGLSQRRLSSGRSMPLWLIFTIAALVGIAGAVVASYTRDRARPVAGGGPDGSVPARPDQRVIAPPRADAAAPPADQAAPARPDSKARKATVVIIIKSTPPGARITGPGGKTLGTTPARITLPAGDKELTLTLRRRGHRLARIPVRPDKDRTLKITLRKRHPGGLPDDPKGWGER